ncbi:MULTISPECIES: hypothetical protein [Myroides]|uniref:hypothetical protein n=1 Tax=Myroides TaxID=76831 RepID=UPI0020980C73|nr:hypothetical protein [Myroides odoratimimus]MCO7724111.1 hypothetical protein [Myroides odoratimimus]MDM1450664.1 hypothetical protein [Myroides odoratimimus]MEC4042077.1 hypothetical protein [Myroides odoratimimus]MEC4149982.1 hypothetical protein [Myroides odoratimimus]
MNADTILTEVINKSLSLPGAKINREQYLQGIFSKYYNEYELELIIEEGTIKRNVNIELIRKLSNDVISSHLVKVTGSSALAGLPGGIALAATIPLDLAQYYYHIIIVAQKLAYLYGWPSLEDTDNEELVSVLILFIGVMFGANAANKAVVELSKRFSVEFVKRVPQKALTKYAVYQLAKQIAKWVGVKMTKETFAKSVSKVIPLLGGVVSGGITYMTFKPMCKRLTAKLEESMIYLK